MYQIVFCSICRYFICFLVSLLIQLPDGDQSHPVYVSGAAPSARASALSAGSSLTQIKIDLPVFESRRPVTACQRMRKAAAEGRHFVFFLTSLNVNNHVLSGVRYTLGAHGPIRINFL